jgi:hypothetical protein
VLLRCRERGAQLGILRGVPAVARRNEVDDAQTDEELLVSSGEDAGKGAISSRRAFRPRDPHARLIIATQAELNGCEASVNKNAVTRTTGMLMLQRERTKEARSAFFVGVPTFAGQQLLTLTRDLASLERSREVAAGQWNFPDPALCRRHERLLIIYAGHGLCRERDLGDTR